MKKIFYICYFIFGVWLFLFFLGWEDLFLVVLLPLLFTAGILMILVQDADKSYQYLPKLFLGSFIIGLGVLAFNWFCYVIDGHVLYLKVIIQSPMAIIYPVGLCLLGGLIGLLIRGTRLVVNGYRNK